MKKKELPLLGAHMSIAGGFDQAYLRGDSIGCTAIQIFTHSNRQWAIKDITPQAIEAAKQTLQETGIKEVIAHSSYLINLGSSTPATLKQSMVTLIKELEHCHDLAIPYLVLHPGGGANQQQAIEQIGDALTEVLEQSSSKTQILLETMAGQGNNVGYQFEQLALMRNRVTQKSRIGFCIDTCHIWAAGYDIATEKGYHEVMDSFDSILGLTNLKAMHINDSKQPRGSRVDRHQELGEGKIGLDAFRFIMNDKRLAHVPKILETPKTELEDYARNMRILFDLII